MRPYNKKRTIRLRTPLTKEAVRDLRAGDEVLLDGDIFTARDQAHSKMVSLIAKRKNLPFELKDQIIYYCGPTKSAPGRVIGACGPTTSSRMDKLTIPLLKKGLKGMIGKGRRSCEVRSAIKNNKAVYFLTCAGAGAFLAKKVLAKKDVCFKELGPEAVYRLTVKDFPLIVAIDSGGRDIFIKKGDF